MGELFGGIGNLVFLQDKQIHQQQKQYIMS